MNYRKTREKGYGIIIAAVAVTIAVMLCGLISGLVLAVRQREENAMFNDSSKQMAGYLLRDSAVELKSTMSALRLCNEVEPAQTLNRTALVHAVRAETALECHSDDWADSRAKEQFLNDISTVLHDYTPEQTMQMSDMLYDYCNKFCAWVTDGTEFEYNGELIPSDGGEHDETVTEDDINAAAEIVKSALNSDKADYVGDYGGHIEFNIERDDSTGYAVVCGKKIIEFAFVRDEGSETDTEQAKQIALETASACGYDGLEVKWCEVTGKSVSVIMCRSYDGAMACDDSAIAVVYGGKTVAFTAGGCDNEHKNIPSPKKSEGEAHKALKSNTDDGKLVVRKMDGKERVCYEYRYELDDGVHYVYVCAESGKQIEVR
ncbi:MAG: hypothetical protein K2J01_05980 [Clostridiales bacterium]|nr:hypothetical protein [Clostridiales bacterium]